MKVLFVCTGNTCRSCMAEAIFNKLSTLEEVEAFSAGISVVPGSRTSKHTASLISSNFDFDISERNAAQLTEEMIKSSDLILTMTGYMRDLLRNHFNSKKEKIYTINEFVELQGDVIDPYGGDIYTYEATFNMLRKSIELLLAKLKEDGGNTY